MRAVVLVGADTDAASSDCGLGKDKGERKWGDGGYGKGYGNFHDSVLQWQHFIGPTYQ